MKIKISIVSLLITIFSFHEVLSDFDCESTTTFSDSKCPSELKCIYDEAYESRSIASCKCKIIINTISLPQNTLNYELFRKVCSQHEERLQQLQLNDADLELIDREIFRKYRNLKVLNLAGNVLRLNFSEQAQGIVEMDLSWNKLTSLKSSSLNNLKHLKVVNVSFNRLNEIDDIFTNFEDLEEVYLNNNQLTVIDDDDFRDLPKLRILNLAHNSIAAFGNDLNLQNLQELYLNDNKLISLNRNHFKNVPNLRILDAARNVIRYVEGGSVAKNDNDDGNLQTQHNPLKLFANSHQNFANSISNRNWFVNSLPNGTQNHFANFLTLPQNQANSENSNRKFGWWIGAPSPRNRRQAPESTTKPQNSGFFLHFGAPAPATTSRSVTVNAKPWMLSNSWLQLHTLDLSGNGIREFPEGFLENLPELQNLNVSHNDLSGFDFKRLNVSLKLTSLDVRGNRLAGLDLNVLRYGWSFLKTIDFDLSLIRCGDVRDVLAYFRERSVVVKSCDAVGGCC